MFNFRKPNGRLDYKNIAVSIGATIAALIVGFTIIMILLIAVLSIGLPDVRDLDKLGVSQSTTIYDREGNVLYVKHGGENREYVTYNQISANVVNATVAIEDDQFWTHPGFDPVGIMRAGVNDVFHLGAKQGGSTITQQYIKNAFLSPEKSFIRKIKELILAVRLEQTYDKKKIMELYLNKIPYGSNAYGIEKASQVFFNKHAKDLDVAESAILASIPKAPTYYSPYGDHAYSIITKTFTPSELARRNIKTESDLHDDEFDRGLIGANIKLDDAHTVYVQGRTDVVLKTMEKFNYIDEAQKKAALFQLQKLKFNEYHDQIKYPHFVIYILKQLEAKYGKEVVEQGGLKVYTSIDPKLQDVAMQIVADSTKINAEKFNTKNASLVAVDPKTGEILAMVGSRNYFDKEIEGAMNIATDSYRQPGSSFKPFVYAQAFYNRYSPGSIVFDTELRLGDQTPKDFDGKFRGPMSIRSALGQSRNIPAIKAYFLAGGTEPILQLAEKMGIHFDPRQSREDLGWTMALGSDGVKLLDMVSAFGVFANGGVRHEPVSILKVQNATGDTFEEWKLEDGTEVLDPQIAYLINSILSDTSVRLGENLTIPGQINAAKTGTSNRQDKGKYFPHDLWAMGYTTKLVAGVWAGNNRDTEGNLSTSADGYNVSAPIWKKFMIEALKDKPSENFPVPPEIQKQTISKITGKLAGPNTPINQQITEVFANFAVPTRVDENTTTVNIDTRNKKLANEYCPAQYVQKVTYQTLHDIAPYPEWERDAQAWMSQYGANLLGTQQFSEELPSITAFGDPPIVTSELCTAQGYNSKPAISIIQPVNDQLFNVGDNITVQVLASGQNGIQKVEFYLDDKFNYFADQPPYQGNVRLPKVENSGSNHHTITAKAIDNNGYTTEAVIQITTGKPGNPPPVEPPPTQEIPPTPIIPPTEPGF